MMQFDIEWRWKHSMTKGVGDIDIETYKILVRLIWETEIVWTVLYEIDFSLDESPPT